MNQGQSSQARGGKWLYWGPPAPPPPRRRARPHPRGSGRRRLAVPWGCSGCRGQSRAPGAREGPGDGRWDLRAAGSCRRGSLGLGSVCPVSQRGRGERQAPGCGEGERHGDGGEEDAETQPGPAASHAAVTRGPPGECGGLPAPGRCQDCCQLPADPSAAPALLLTWFPQLPNASGLGGVWEKGPAPCQRWLQLLTYSSQGPTEAAAVVSPQLSATELEGHELRGGTLCTEPQGSVKRVNA